MVRRQRHLCVCNGWFVDCSLLIVDDPILCSLSLRFFSLLFFSSSLLLQLLLGVGENLQDHLQIRSAYRLKEGTVTLNSWKKAGSLAGQALLGLEYALFQTGPLSMAPSQFGIFANSERSGGSPDLQFHIQPLSLDDLSNPQSMHSFPGLTTSVCNLRPTSRGTVTPSGPTTQHPPNINPNYLDTEHDQLVAADALRLARRLVLESKSFREKYIPSEHFPGLHIESDDDLAREAGNISTSIFHPVGTCKMGRRDDPMVRQLLCDIISYQQMALHVAHMYTTYRFIHVLFPCSVSSFSFCLTIC
jgi:choline dehydrogenase-like flavoprotein